MQRRETEDLLDDVADVHGSGRRAACLDLGAQVAQVLRADLGHQPVAEHRHDVPVDDALAHRLGALGHPGFFQPAVGELLEGLGLGRPELLALLLLGGRSAFGDRLARFRAALARHQKRDPVLRPVAADRERFAPAVEPVVETESDRAPGGNGYVHSVPVGDLVGGGLGFDASERAIGQHRRSLLSEEFYRHDDLAATISLSC